MGELFEELGEAVGPGRALAGRARYREPVRDQVTLEACDLESLIDETHPARLIWAYAERVDMSGFEAGVRAREGTPGMAQTSPHLLLALWLYATTDGVGSGRALARLCRSAAAYRWLCGGVGVNHRLLSDFRNDQGARIEDLLTLHVASLSKAGLIDLDEVAQDGVRVRASAGAGSFRRRRTLEGELAKAKALLERLARDDDDHPGPTGRQQRAARERAARERAARVEAALEALGEAEKLRQKRERTNRAQSARQKAPRASTTDAEARVMKMADGGFRPAYNVQFASLPQSGIILAVTCESVGSDRGLGEPMAQKLARDYGRRPRRHLVDGGYLAYGDIEAAAGAGTEVYCPPTKPKSGRDPLAPRQKDSPPVAAWRVRMASEEGQATYRRRAIGELVHARLRNLGLDKLHVRGSAKVVTCMRWFALAMNLLTAHRLGAA